MEEMVATAATGELAVMQATTPTVAMAETVGMEGITEDLVHQEAMEETEHQEAMVAMGQTHLAAMVVMVLPEEMAVITQEITTAITQETVMVPGMAMQMVNTNS